MTASRERRIELPRHLLRHPGLGDSHVAKCGPQKRCADRDFHPLDGHAPSDAGSAACAGLAAALAALHLLNMSTRAKIVLAVGGAWLASTLTFAWGCSGAGIDLGLSDYLLLGRTEDASSLSGRIPLWTELLGYVEQRPILGYRLRQLLDCPAHRGCERGFRLDRIRRPFLLPGRGSQYRCGGTGSSCRPWPWACTGSRRDIGPRARAVLRSCSGCLTWAAWADRWKSMFLQPMFVPFVVACGIGQVAFRPLDIS